MLTNTRTKFMIEAVHVRLGDEKVPEDYHQHARDLSRAQRHKRAAMSALCY